MLLATRLNRVMKQETSEWQSLCRGFGVIGILIVAANVFCMMNDAETEWLHSFKLWAVIVMIGCGVKSLIIESQRDAGNKFKHILIFQYLCKKSNANEISDSVAEEFDRLPRKEREEITRKLNIQLLLCYVIAATIILMI